MAFNIAVVTLLGEKLGVGGIALVSGIAVLLNMAINGIIAKKTAILRPTAGDAWDIIKSVLSAAVMGGAVWGNHQWTAPMGELLSLTLSILTGVAVYALLTLILRSEEMKMLKGIITKKR
jgi:peptidoglycan biosynthesis protein MviN/MurJ (putative lipid II flippase)